MKRTKVKEKIVAIFRTGIIYFAMVFIGILAIPVCIFFVPIMLIWKLTGKIISWLE